MAEIHEKSMEHSYQKQKKEVITDGKGKTMHSDKSRERNTQTEKFSYRKKDMPGNSRDRTKLSFRWLYNGYMQSYTMNNKIILCRLSSQHLKMSPSHINLTQASRAMLKHSELHYSSYFHQNRILPVQHQDCNLWLPFLKTAS